MSVISQILSLSNNLKNNLCFSVGRELVFLYEKLVSSLNHYLDRSQLIKIYRRYLNINSNDYYFLRKKMEYLIDDYQKEKKFFLIQSIISNSLKNLFKLGKIQKYYEENNDIDYSSSMQYVNFSPLDIQINFGDFNSSLTLGVNRNFNFIIEKKYKSMVKKENIEKEFNICKDSFKPRDSKIPSFVIHSHYSTNSSIYLPYFPFRTLKNLLIQKKNKSIVVTNVDKLVIMKEIIIGLNQLFQKRIFHQNLCSSYIYINGEKDAYISSFAYDSDFEQNQTRLPQSTYYRDPKNINHIGPISLENYENADEFMKYDIYSYGILLYEISTMISLSDLFTTKTKEQLFQILKSIYHELLFDQYKNVDFDDFVGIKGVRNIIEKCLRINFPFRTHNNDNYDYQSIILDIENLDLYIQNKEEIEYRISHAANMDTYQCSLEDIIENYLQGNEYSLNIIKSFFRLFSNKKEYEMVNKSLTYDDLMKVIFDFFGFKNPCIDVINKNLFFAKQFDDIIAKDAFSAIDVDKIGFNYQYSLLKLSIDENKLFKMIPISSMKMFLNTFNVSNNIIMMIYFIAKEISSIHLNKMFHGELSLDSIGIYYNSETNSFLPAIIPFYLFYLNKRTNTVNSTKRIDIHKKQKKDIQSFLNIIKELDENLYMSLNDITVIYSIEFLVNQIYNIILNSSNANDRNDFFKNYSQYKYSSFEIKFRTFYSIFLNPNENDIVYKAFKYFFIDNNLYFNFEDSLRKIISFSNQQIQNMNEKIDFNQDDEDENITSLLFKIKDNNDILLQICEKKKKEHEMQIEKEENNKYTNPKRYDFDVVNYTYYQKKNFEEKNKVSMNNYVSRTLEITEMDIKSIIFIINRYIRMLNPKFNHKLIIKITNRIFSVHQKYAYKLTDIEKIVKQNHYDHEVKNGAIIIEIKKRE